MNLESDINKATVLSNFSRDHGSGHSTTLLTHSTHSNSAIATIIAEYSPRVSHYPRSSSPETLSSPSAHHQRRQQNTPRFLRERVEAMPSTPVKMALAPPALISDSPGTWRHPRLNEITRRRNATTFSEKNVRQIVYGVSGIVLIWVLRALLRTSGLDLYVLLQPAVVHELT